MFRHTDVSKWCGLQGACINMTRNNELESCKTTDCVHLEPLTTRCDVIQIMLYWSRSFGIDQCDTTCRLMQLEYGSSYNLANIKRTAISWITNNRWAAVKHWLPKNQFHLACTNFLYALSVQLHYYCSCNPDHPFVFHYVIMSSYIVCSVLFIVTRQMETGNYVTCNQPNNSFQY
jgi:hypothetical protein